MRRQAESHAVTPLLAHSTWVRRLARAMTADPAAADDTAQDTWMSALRRPPMEGGSPRAWLRTVARNHVFRRALEERRRAAREAIVAGAADEATSGPDDAFERREVTRLLAESVAALPERSRAIVVLRYFEERSSVEIAELLGEPEGTVRWRLKTAMDQLRAEMDARCGEDGRRFLGVAFVALGALAGVGAGVAFVSSGSEAPVPGESAGAPSRAFVSLPPPPEQTARPAPFPTEREPTRAFASLPVLPEPAGRAARLPTPEQAGQTSRLPAPASPELVACHAELARVRADADVAENLALSSVPPAKLFERGAENPLAEAAMRPALDRPMSGDGGPWRPTYQLECRTYACRMTVLRTEAELHRPQPWKAAVLHDREVGVAGARVRRVDVFHGGAIRDPATGLVVDRSYAFFSLGTTSGARVAYLPHTVPGHGPVPRLVEDGSGPPPPATLAGCREEVASQRARTLQGRADALGHLAPAERFARGAPNRALGAEISKQMRHVLMAGHWPETSAAAVCRADVCRFDGLDLVAEEWKQLAADERFAMRLGRHQGPYWEITTGATLETQLWMRQVLDGLVASDALDECARQSPMRGHVGVGLFLTRVGSADGSPRLEAEYGGALFGTPAGACVARQIHAALAAQRIPQNAVATRVWTKLAL